MAKVKLNPDLFYLERLNLVPSRIVDGFSCGADSNVKDIDEFFKSKAVQYESELLWKSYCLRTFQTNHKSKIVAAFTLSNAQIPSNEQTQKNVSKRFRFYPAILIGQLGVDMHYSGNGVGSFILNFVKMFFLDPQNKSGCRFIIVDALADKIRFYQKNDFKFVFETEDSEKEAKQLKTRAPLRTRMMYFDLLTLKQVVSN
ncbi:MAG: N-acetyltransferase [Fibrobacter sp.]|nr:N-acetyltransferase [Fibrobacter sp.]